jgi:hypothetical protein
LWFSVPSLCPLCLSIFYHRVHRGFHRVPQRFFTLLLCVSQCLLCVLCV